jgi:hypothetical protein
VNLSQPAELPILKIEQLNEKKEMTPVRRIFLIQVVGQILKMHDNHGTLIGQTIKTKARTKIVGQFHSKIF